MRFEESVSCRLRRMQRDDRKQRADEEWNAPAPFPDLVRRQETCCRISNTTLPAYQRDILKLE